MNWSPLELIAMACGVVSVYLSVREHVWSWPTGIVNVTLYVVIFYQAKLYANMGLQVVYIVLSVYGWYNWLYGGANRSTLAVSRTPRRVALLLPVVGVAGAIALGAVLARHTDDALPYAESATTAVSLIAQWMMTRKFLESWILWIVVDVAYVVMFVRQDLLLTAALYALFLALAVNGFVTWKRSLRAASAR